MWLPKNNIGLIIQLTYKNSKYGILFFRIFPLIMKVTVTEAKHVIPIGIYEYCM